MLDLKRSCALVSTLSLLSGAAFAGQLPSPQDLLDLCQQDAKADFCQGYIAGVADAAAGVCVPEGIQASTLADLAISSLEKSSASADLSAAEVVSARLLQVFPCDSEADSEETSTGSSSSKSKNWSNKERIGK